MIEEILARRNTVKAEMEAKGELIEEGESCSCGGVIDKLYLLDNIYQSRCFQCGKLFVILKR